MPSDQPCTDSQFNASPASLPTSAHSAQMCGIRVPKSTVEEHDSLSFDVEDEIASIIPMPRTIPADLQAAITLALSGRFEFYDDELDAWLHTPNDALGGASPFDRLVDGDGVAVLLALADQPPNAQATPVFDATPRRHLNIVG